MAGIGNSRPLESQLYIDAAAATQEQDAQQICILFP